MDEVIKTDFYKANVFRFYLEKINATIDMTVTNSISWDTNSYTMTRHELKGLVDFINNFLENTKQ